MLRRFCLFRSAAQARVAAPPPVAGRWHRVRQRAGLSKTLSPSPAAPHDGSRPQRGSGNLSNRLFVRDVVSFWLISRGLRGPSGGHQSSGGLLQAELSARRRADGVLHLDRPSTRQPFCLCVRPETEDALRWQLLPTTQRPSLSLEGACGNLKKPGRAAKKKARRGTRPCQRNTECDASTSLTEAPLAMTTGCHLRALSPEKWMGERWSRRALCKSRKTPTFSLKIQWDTLSTLRRRRTTSRQRCRATNTASQAIAEVCHC